LSPCPWRVAVPAEIQRTGGAGGRGKGGEATRDSPRLDLGAWLGKKGLPAGWTAAPGGGRHWSSCSGEPPAEEEQWAVWVVLRWSRESAERVGR
jgi:hypothetical protein